MSAERCFIDTNVLASEDLRHGAGIEGVRIVNPFAGTLGTTG
jgi:predicted nucleic acid-binding protein